MRHCYFLQKNNLCGDVSLVPKLITAVNQIWEDLGKNDKEIIENLALSVPDHLNEVETRKGRPTKYQLISYMHHLCFIIT